MADTQQFIIDKAYRLFLNHSYEAVSISTISEATGLTKGALYHHFKNKEELFKAVIDKHFSITTVSVDVQNVTLKEYTEVCIDHAYKILSDIFSDDGIFMPINHISLIADSFRHYKNFASIKLKFIDEEINKVQTIIKNAIKRGEIRKDINTRIVALQYFSFSIGMAGDLIRRNSISSAINLMKEQLNQLYQLLKI